MHLSLALAGISKYKEKCINCVKLILSSEKENEPININIRDRLGRTIFHLAAMHGLVELI